jgi:hypothetical protein
VKKATKISCTVVLAVLVTSLFWEAMYPDKYDPKNPHYVLWKWHLASIDLDRAVSVIHHDRWSERMIIGKSEKSLTSRFGYLLPPVSASPCLRAPSQGIDAAGDKVLFLRKSDYAIIFHDGVAIRVVLLNQAEPC